jgi:hypothetical protein
MTLRLQHSGQTAAIVLGLAAGGTGTFLTRAEAEAWRNTAWAAFRNLTLSSVSCTGATVRAVDGSEKVWELGAPPSPAGATAGVETIAAGCWLLKWSTNTGGRSGKGRTFLPGLPQSQVNPDGRTYATTATTHATTAINAYLGGQPFTSQGHLPAVLSFRDGVAYPITGGALAAVIGLQRRRMRG